MMDRILGRWLIISAIAIFNQRPDIQRWRLTDLRASGGISWGEPLEAEVGGCSPGTVWLGPPH
jgi:hypothetical protein